MKNRAVFLDRDGVINRSDVVDGKPYAPTRLEDFEILPNTYKAVHALKQAGFTVIVVTNQPDIGNGLVDRSVIERMNEIVRKIPGIDGLYMCAHRQDQGCSCRKPQPGMLVEAAEKFDVDLARSFIVGDRKSDIIAGQAAGCSTVFIDCGYLNDAPPSNPGWVTSSLDAEIGRAHV